MVAQALAVRKGSRCPREATFMPNLMRFVPPARAAMTDMTSRFGMGLTRRSDCQIESTPPLSQRSTQRQKARPLEKGKWARPRPALMVITELLRIVRGHGSMGRRARQLLPRAAVSGLIGAGALRPKGRLQRERR